MKVRNLKANHSGAKQLLLSTAAVLASMKVRNLKANHNMAKLATAVAQLY